MYRILTTAALVFASFAGYAVEPVRFEFEAASPSTLGNPHDLVLDGSGERLLVSDVNNDRITVLDADTLEVIGSFADGLVDEPHDVAVGPAGRIYVADTGNSRIAIFELDGLSAQPAGELKQRLRRPEGVAVNADGHVYASGAGSSNLVHFGPGGEVLAEATGFRSPHDVAIAADGTLWLADAGNDRMVRLDAALNITTVLDGEPYAFNGPRYLDIAANGHLVIADKYAHQVKVTNAAGELLGVLGSGSRGEGEGVFTTPEGVEIRGDRVWFSDSGNNRVVRYRMSGGT